MILRRADCGHYIEADAPPAGLHLGSEAPVYLCGPCAERARGSRVETKSLSDLQFTARKDLPAMRASMDEAVRRMNAGVTDAASLGALDARDGRTEEDCPYPDKRTKEAREWVRGFREASEAVAASG